MKRTVLQDPLASVVDSRFFEIPEVTIAGGASATTVIAVPLPFTHNMIKAIVGGRDATNNDVAMYELTAMVRNVSAKWAYATQTLTFSGVATDTQTVTLGTKVYTTQASLTNADGNVLIGANQTATSLNLARAITLGAGAGTLYAAAMTLHPTITAVESSATVVATAKVAGNAANSYATTETQTNASWGNTTLLGGVDAAALIGSVDAITAEIDSGWAATITVDGVNSTALVQCTPDGSNNTVFFGSVRVYKI
jgi:hypothetical protein